MKLSNVKTMKKRLLGILTLLVFGVMILMFLIFYFSSAAIFFGIALFGFLLTVGILSECFRCFEYENPGSVVTIKYYYPFLMSRKSVVEFPGSKLLKFEIGHRYRTPVLTLHLQSQRRGNICIRYFLSGFDKEEIRDLRISLENLLGQNNI